MDACEEGKTAFRKCIVIMTLPQINEITANARETCFGSNIVFDGIIASIGAMLLLKFKGIMPLYRQNIKKKFDREVRRI